MYCIGPRVPNVSTRSQPTVTYASAKVLAKGTSLILNYYIMGSYYFICLGSRIPVASTRSRLISGYAKTVTTGVILIFLLK